MCAQEIVTGYGQDLAYDLRQTYAKIVGEHLQDIAEARKSEAFYTWFKNLEDLHTIVKHKFKKESDEIEYQNAVNKLVVLANKYKSVWLGNAKDPEPHSEIEKVLREIEMILYDKMNDANMFGQSNRIAGL